jgi:methyl-accepting chemotaxis protein
MRNKFLMLAGIVSFVFVISMFMVKMLNDKIAHNFTRFYDGNFHISQQLDDLQSIQVDIVLNIRGLQIAYLLKLDNQVDGYLRTLAADYQLTPELVDTLIDEYTGSNELVIELDKAISIYHESAKSFVQAMNSSPDNKAPFPVFKAFMDAYADVNTAFNDINNIQNDQAERIKDETLGTIDSQNIIFYTSIFIAIVLAILLSRYMSIIVLRSINKVKDAAEKMATGNLLVTLDLKGNDEIAQLGKSLNNTIIQLKKTLNDVSESSLEVSDNSNVLLNSNREIQTTANEMTDHLGQISNVLNEFSTCSVSIEETTIESVTATNEIKTLASRGMNSSKDTMVIVTSLVDGLNQASNVVNKLQEESNKIESILSVIRSIAEQTNLLALNAAIEAARAGEQGRGFAVVADEVRTLAQRSQDSVNEIESMLTELSSASKNAVKIMGDSAVSASDTEESMQENNVIIENIQTMIETVNDKIQFIADSAGHQNSLADSIQDRMQSLEQLTVRTVDISNESSGLTEMGHKVKHQLEYFKVK